MSRDGAAILNSVLPNFQPVRHHLAIVLGIARFVIDALIELAAVKAPMPTQNLLHDRVQAHSV